METCTTCGATLRPGSRFCTTCGTRVHQPATDDSGWGAAARSVEPDSQQTAVFTPVAAPEPEPQAAPIAMQSHTRDWGNAYENSETSADPASRFVTALDGDVKPVDDTGWGKPAEADSTYPTWSFDSGDDEKPAPEHAPEEAVASIPEDTTPEPAMATPVAAIASQEKDEAAKQALSLVAQLQQLIPQLASSSADEGAAAMTLTEASLKTSDFSDLSAVITQVKDDPRDIRALSELAEKIDRVEALLHEHEALSTAIESALHDLGST